MAEPDSVADIGLTAPAEALVERATAPERSLPPATEMPALPAEARRLSSEALFAGERELLIEHEGQIYRLRRTRGGKLILNK